MRLKINLMLASVLCLPPGTWAAPNYGVQPGTILTGTNNINKYGGTIDGDDDTGYFLKSGSLTISNATLQNFLTKGGAGSGGGAAMGGAIFVNSDAVLTLNSVNILGNTAIGGKGGYGSDEGKLNGFSQSSLGGNNNYGGNNGHGYNNDSYGGGNNNNGHGNQGWGNFGFGGESGERGGFGGGNGSGYSYKKGGNGGNAYGGGIFVRDEGKLVITGNSTFGDNAVQGGSGQSSGRNSYAGSAGTGIGTDLFMMKGSTVILDAGTGNVITFNGNGSGSSIADDSETNISNSNIATGQGAGITVKSGLVIFNGRNTYTGQTKIEGGVLQAQDGYGIHTYSNINLDGGVLQSNGTFTRYLGTTGSRIQWTGSGGFAAVGGDLTVRLNNGQELEWSRNNFVSGDDSLIFGSTSATHNVIFQNSIDLNDRDRSILVRANEDNSNHAILTGVLSDGGLIVGGKYHTGVLVLTNENTYRDGTTIKGGTLALADCGSLYSKGDVYIYSDANFDISMSDDQKIGKLSGNGTVHLGEYSLTVDHYRDATFNGVIKDGGLGGGTGGSFIKKGHGELTLNGDSTYTGDTILKDGTLTLNGSLASSYIEVQCHTTFNNNDGGLSADAELVNDGTINQNSDDTVASLVNSGTINNSEFTLTATTYALNDGSVINANLGTGTVTANGDVDLNGTSAAATFNVESGTTTLGSTGRLLDTVDLTVSSEATLILGGLERIGSLFGAGTVDTACDGSLFVDDGSFSGDITGDGSLIKLSTGKLVLSGANTYTGLTLVKEGTLELSADGSLASDKVFVMANATLDDLNGGLDSCTTLFNQGLVNIGNVDETVKTLINSGTINSGTLDDEPIIGGATLTADKYFLKNGSQINADLGTGTLYTFGTVWLNGASEAALVKIFEESTLILGDAERLWDEAEVIVDGTLILGGNETIKILNGDGLVDMSGFQLIVTDGGMFQGTIDASGTKFFTDGDLTLTGETDTLTTDIREGTLTISPTGHHTSPHIIVHEGANMNLQLGSEITYELLNGGGVVFSSSFVNKENSTVGGTLSFSGDFTNNGTFAPGNSPGIINIGGNYVENALLNIELGGLAGPGVDPDGFDQVRVVGTVTVNPGAELLVESYNGFRPKRGSVFQIISDATGGPVLVNGTFTDVRYDLDGAGAALPTNSAAILFDVATGQLRGTGLVGRGFSGLGENNNQRRAARALFSTALIAPYQIDSSTQAGRLALQIVDAVGNPNDDLARYTPESYGAVADYAFAGDLAISRSIQDRVSLLVPLGTTDIKSGGVFAGFIQNETSGVGGSDVSRSDYFVGGDVLAAKGFSAGVAVTMNDGSISSSLGSSELEGIGGLTYARYELPKGFSLWGTFGYTAYDVDFNRDTVNGSVNGSTDAESLTALLGVGYKGWNVGDISIAPRLSLMYSQATLEGFTESGAIDALRNNGYDADVLSAELGFSAVWSKEIVGHTLSVEFAGGLQQDLTSNQDDMDVQLASNPAAQYQLEFADRDATRAVGRVNIGYNLWKNGTVYAGYEGRTGDGSGTHVFRAGLRVNF